MQKVVFKQQFKAFTISSLEGLEKGYDRFQQLLSQLEAHGAEKKDALAGFADEVYLVPLCSQTIRGLGLLLHETVNRLMTWTFERDGHKWQIRNVAIRMKIVL
ncbi:hypothetical protein Tco_0574273 [Tanacetum coccineum]